MVLYHFIDALWFAFFVLSILKISWLHIIIIGNFPIYQIGIQLVLILEFDSFDHFIFGIFVGKSGVLLFGGIEVRFLLFNFLDDFDYVAVVIYDFIVDFDLFVVRAIPAFEFRSGFVLVGMLVLPPLLFMPLNVGFFVHLLQLVPLLLFPQRSQPVLFGNCFLFQPFAFNSLELFQLLLLDGEEGLLLGFQLLRFLGFVPPVVGQGSAVRGEVDAPQKVVPHFQEVVRRYVNICSLL